MQTSPVVFQFDNSSLVYSNPATNDDTTIPFFDETQQNSLNEERKSQRTRNYSYISERNKQDNQSTVTVNK